MSILSLPSEGRVFRKDQAAVRLQTGFPPTQESPLLIAISTTKDDNGLFSKQ